MLLNTLSLGKIILRRTHYSQFDLVSPRGRGGHLALVEPLVPVCDGADAQLPEVRQRDVVGGEALVGRVRVPANGQQVDVAVADPRDLEQWLMY